MNTTKWSSFASFIEPINGASLTISGRVPQNMTSRMPGELLLYDTCSGTYCFPLVPLLNTEDNVTKEVDRGSVTHPKLTKQTKAKKNVNKSNTIRLVLIRIEGFRFMVSQVPVWRKGFELPICKLPTLLIPFHMVRVYPLSMFMTGLKSRICS